MSSPVTSHSTLNLVVDGRVARVTFTRPERANSLTEQVLVDLTDVVATVRTDDSIRALVITGSGDFFCVGLDKDLVAQGVDDHGYFAERLEALTDLLAELEALEVPTVAVVNGLARAGGFELLLACDLVLIDEAIRIGDVHTVFGMPPGGGSSARLTRRVGLQRATEIVLTARWLTGAEAAQVGIALQAYPADELGAATESLVASLVDKGRGTLSTAKRMLRHNSDVPVAEGIRFEREAFLELLDAPGSDSVEGFRAWQEKRPPTWA